MNTESTKKSRGHGFFVLFFTFYIKTMKNHKKAPKSTKKHEKALKSKLGVFLMYLRKLLLINPAAVKRDHHKGLKKKWKKEWTDTARGQKAACIDGTTPSKKFLKSISQTKLSHVNTS